MPQSQRTYRLSPSSIGLMEECPRCFWMQFNKNKRRPEGIFSSLPNGMDYILKVYFDKFRDKEQLPPELRENKDCKDCRLFPDKEKLDNWRNNLKGISWTDKEGNVLFGAIDNLLISKNNRIIVLDYKTRGFPLKENTAEYYKDQLNIYNFLLRKNGYETEDYSFLLFYIPKEVKDTGEVIFNTHLIKIKTDTSEAEKLWKKALKLLNGPLSPKHEEENERCAWCELTDLE